ncbi:MAG: CRP-like cAMP-binding protein, partial [Flavobacteriales bacterium]
VKNGGERVLTTLREDAIFGQIALVDSGKRTATCRALGDVHLARLQRADFDTLFTSGSTFAFLFQEAIAKVAVGQLRHANSRLQLLMLQAKSSNEDLEEVSDILSMRDAREGIRWDG